MFENYSIKERLYIALIFFLLVTLALITIIFLIIPSVLNFNESLVLLIPLVPSAVAVVTAVLGIGKLLIKETDNKYKKFSKPKISSLIEQLVQATYGDIENEIEEYHTTNLDSRCNQLLETASSFQKHGSFLGLRLYPELTIQKIPDLVKDIQDYIELMSQLRPYWDKWTHFFPDFAKFVVEGEKGFEDWEMLFQARERRLKLEAGEPELPYEIGKIRAKISDEINKIVTELQYFLDHNR